MTKENQDMLTTGNFTIQAQLPQGKSLVVSGYIYAHQVSSEVNEQIDFMMSAVDRQYKLAEIPALERMLKQHTDNLSLMRDGLLHFESKIDSGIKLTPADKKKMEDAPGQLAFCQQKIEEHEHMLAEAKRAVGLA